MLSFDQLDDLEGRIIRALELIADLRDDNARLEQVNQDLESQHTAVQEENNQLQEEQRQLRAQLAEKEQEIASIRQELEHTNVEVEKIRNQEQNLQTRINSILHQLDRMPTQTRQPTKHRETTSSFHAESPSVDKRRTDQNMQSSAHRLQGETVLSSQTVQDDTVPIRDPRNSGRSDIEEALGEKKKHPDEILASDASDEHIFSESTHLDAADTAEKTSLPQNTGDDEVDWTRLSLSPETLAALPITPSLPTFDQDDPDNIASVESETERVEISATNANLEETSAAPLDGTQVEEKQNPSLSDSPFSLRDFSQRIRSDKDKSNNIVIFEEPALPLSAAYTPTEEPEQRRSAADETDQTATEVVTPPAVTPPVPRAAVTPPVHRAKETETFSSPSPSPKIQEIDEAQEDRDDAEELQRERLTEDPEKLTEILSEENWDSEEGGLDSEREFFDFAEDTQDQYSLHVDE